MYFLLRECDLGATKIRLDTNRLGAVCVYGSMVQIPNKGCPLARAVRAS